MTRSPRLLSYRPLPRRWTRLPQLSSHWVLLEGRSRDECIVSIDIQFLVDRPRYLLIWLLEWSENVLSLWVQIVGENLVWSKDSTTYQLLTVTDLTRSSDWRWVSRKGDFCHFRETLGRLELNLTQNVKGRHTEIRARNWKDSESKE